MILRSTLGNSNSVSLEQIRPPKVLDMDPLVSILIPAYNAENWIPYTPQSAVDQTWPKKEIIVVNHRRLQPLGFGSGEGQTPLLNENLFARPGGAHNSQPRRHYRGSESTQRGS